MARRLIHEGFTLIELLIVVALSASGESRFQLSKPRSLQGKPPANRLAVARHGLEHRIDNDLSGHGRQGDDPERPRGSEHPGALLRTR